MKQLTRGSRLVVASHNPGKVWEINQLIAPYGLNAISAGELGLTEPEETEPTFAGNATLKAYAAAKGAGLPALADDSGLEVEVLGGAPGIYSARWAGPGKDFGVAMKKVADEISTRGGWPAHGMYGLGPRANFISVLCLAWPDGSCQMFEGKVFGHLVWPPRGGNGFGYDPMFVADGETQTFGQMAPEQKYAISHRTRAFAAFKAECLEHMTGESAPQSGAKTGRDMDALRAAAANLSTKEELFRFISNLLDDHARNQAAWGSATIDAYLKALQGHLKDTVMPEAEPRWRTIAKALLAASERGGA
jgi:XTP/dITP diphosphohydrolase